MNIASIASVLPDYYYDQDTMIEALRHHWAGRHHNVDRLEKIHRNALVKGRYLALPIEEYERLETFTESSIFLTALILRKLMQSLKTVRWL